jgi:uncharacterized membrane protein YadS
VNNASPKTFSPLPGLGVAIVIAIISTILSFGHASLDPLVLSILISIIVGNLLGPYFAFCFSIPIAGIGLPVDIESIIDVGPKPLLGAFIGWILLITLFILGVGLIQ